MNSLPPDPWYVLGLEKSADKSEIRSAYKKLVLKCHPDKVQDPTLKAEKQDEFQKVQQAYELLNNDGERIKYEDQVKLMELRKKAAMLAKSSSNTSAARTPPMKQYSFDARTSDARYKPATQPAPPAAKIYTQYTTHSRSHEDAPRAYAVYEAEPRSARRTASTDYAKTSSRRERDRDEERRDREKEDKRRRREEEEKEKERERLFRRAEKKRLDKERKHESEEKLRRRRDPYIENYADEEEQVYIAAKPEKKKSSSSSKKHAEPRERERSSRREEHEEAIPIRLEPRKKKTDEYIHFAADYIERTRAKATAQSPGAYQEGFTKFSPPLAPSPPPVDPFEEESLRRSALRAAGRRPSNDTPKKEKSSSSRRQTSKEDFDFPDSGGQRIPTLAKSYSVPSPQMTAGSPPRVSRSNTAQEAYSRNIPPPPSFSRSKTWAVSEEAEHMTRDSFTTPYYESEEEQQPRRHRSRRTPETVRHKVSDDGKVLNMEGYSYSESPSSRRHGLHQSRSSGSNAYTSSNGFKVKTTPDYSVEDVAYSQVPMSAHASAGNYRVPAY